jgi:RNA polymerase sigma-70 factor (ECF subfamily)
VDGRRDEDVTVPETDPLDLAFETHRTHLRAVAWRMLGSPSDADDALQEAWLRLHRAGAGPDDPRAWLTTVVARICLDMLRARASRREESLEGLAGRLPDPVVTGPEQQVVEADSVALALLVVLDALRPVERVAFVLHDLFAVPFDEVAAVLDRSPAAVRQLASRARRRVAGAALPDPDLGRQRAVVDAFLAAARDGDVAALTGLLDPAIVLRAEVGGRVRLVTGPGVVAGQARLFAARALSVRPVLVNGAAGLLATGPDGPLALLAFTVAGDRVAALDIYAEAARIPVPA